MLVPTDCKVCSNTGIVGTGTEWQRFCDDCLTGNTLHLKAQGSKLDPAKYPPCQFDWETSDPTKYGPCSDDKGLLPDGSSCDCNKSDIVAFESHGYSHEMAVKLMAVLTSCDEGCDEPLRSLINKIDETRDQFGLIDASEASAVTKLLEENPEAVQQALDHSYLRVFV